MRRTAGGGAVISFEESAFAEYWQWAAEDKKIFGKINQLITEILRDPFHGTGKPEPLKGNLSGHWSPDCVKSTAKRNKMLGEIKIEKKQ